MKLKLENRSSALNLDATFDCGQVFRWERAADGAWCGVVYGRLVRLTPVKGGIEVEAAPQADARLRDLVSGYLALDDDMEMIFKDIFSSLEASGEKTFIKVLEAAFKKYKGLRLVRGEPFETAASYILSRNNNIRSISRTIYFISQYLSGKTPLSLPGYANSFDGLASNYPFPDAAGFLSSRFDKFCMECTVKMRYPASQKKELSLLASGYGKASFWASVMNGNRAVPWPEENLQAARRKLLEILGVGNKVCDCIMLFSLNHLNSFPVDRWVLRMLGRYSSSPAVKKLAARCDTLGRISDADYRRFTEYARSVFGRFCGYAGEYLFYNERTDV